MRVSVPQHCDMVSSGTAYVPDKLAPMRLVNLSPPRLHKTTLLVDIRKPLSLKVSHRRNIYTYLYNFNLRPDTPHISYVSVKFITVSGCIR